MPTESHSVEVILLVRLVLLRFVRVIRVGRRRSRGGSVCRVDRRPGHGRTAGSRRLFALHLELLGLALAFLGGLKLFVLYQLSARGPRMIGCKPTYPCNDLLDALLVTLHLQECLDLADGEVLPVAKRDELIEGTEQFVGIP